MSKKNELQDLAQWACDAAVKAGADEARATASRSRYTSLEYREQKVEALEESMRKSVSVSLFINGKYSGHRTSDLRKDAVIKFIGESVAMTKYLTEDPYRKLPDPKYYGDQSEADLDLVDSKYDAVAPEDRHRLIQELELAALDAGGDKIISVEAGYYDSLSETATVNSNGFSGYAERTDFWTGASVTAKDEGDKRPSDWWWEGNPHRDRLGAASRIGKIAVSRALDRIGSEKLPTEKMTIVVENRAAGRLLGFMQNGLYGRNLQQKSSYLEGKKGEQIASELLTIYDDPFVPRGNGSRHFDDEGLSARRMPIIEKGVLKNYYIDSYYARKLGVEATTGGGSNGVFDLGDKDQAGWLREVGRGLLVTGFLGGNSNSSTGDFSTGVQGFLFENGEIVRPVGELNVAGNHLEFWHSLIGLGNDPYPFSSLLTPTLVFDGVTVAGA